jgi:hypothetical protein
MKNLSFIAFLLLCNISLSCKSSYSTPTEITEEVMAPLEPVAFNVKDTEEEKKPDFSKYILQQDLVAYAASSPSLSMIQKLNAPFDTLQFNKVIAYDYEGSEQALGRIMISGGYEPVVLKQQYLTNNQAEKLLNVLTSKSTYGGSNAACFNPHLAIVLYNDAKIVCAVDVCLECNYLKSTTAIPAQRSNKQTFEGRDYYPPGFSQKGQKELKQFCTKLGFSH